MSTIALGEHIRALQLVDNHMHGYWTTTVDRQVFENGLNEANTEDLADFDSGFDTQLGFAVRAHCAPLLGLAAHADADDYWDRRSRYSADQLAELFLTAAAVGTWLLDTGLTDRVAGLDELSRITGGEVREIVRLEQVAEQAAAAGGDYIRTFREILETRAAGAAATKTVLAYRGGFSGDLSAPGDSEVRTAAAEWCGGDGTRLRDRTLLRFGIHEALRLGKPLQFHVGLGDRDCDLNDTNPLLLLEFLRNSGQTPIVLLHCYPYEREAGYLAQAFNHVYVDTGLTVNHLGARAGEFIARTLELTPFRKLLYSSDAFGPPELHYLGSHLWRRGITTALTEFVSGGGWSVGDAIRVATLVGSENARRLYGL